MSKKRILRGLQLDKIAVVDFPCQEGAVVTIMKRDFSADRRSELADSGAAMPDGSFPIVTAGDLSNAIKAHGRAKNPEAARRHIVARAKALGKTDMLPDAWKRRDELRLRALKARVFLLQISPAFNPTLAGFGREGVRQTPASK